MTHLLVATIPVFSQLEDVMKHVLNFFHSTFGFSWAWAIVGTTVVVRMLLVPLMIKQIHSMQSLQLHAPEMKRIQQKYKQDKQKQQEELMKFYRENKINPAASCLPMLLQFPVFIALYYTLRHFNSNFLCTTPATSGTTKAAVSACDAIVRHTDLSFLHFIPSIADGATSHWGGYVLLVVYVVSQVASTFFMSSSAQKSQRYIMMLLPLVFVTFIAHFPAGLTLYWVTTNLWVVGQGLITRRLIQRTPAPAPEKRSSRAPSKDEEEGPDGNGKAGNGASPKPADPKPAPAVAAAPRQVRRKKSSGRRR